MLVEYFREESFGYIVVNNGGGVTIVNSEAGNYLKPGESIDTTLYKPKKLNVNEPFHLTSPLIVMLETTRRCNVTCGHCYLSAGKPRKNEMDTETIFDVLDQLRKMKVSHIFITGGEPFLRSDIADIINYARECNFFIQIVTNGTMLAENIVSRIKNDNHIGFSISYLGGLNSGLSNDEAFTLLKKKGALLREHGFLTYCWFCVTKSNIDNMYDVGKWCLEHGIRADFNDVMLIGRCKENRSLLLDIDDVETFQRNSRRVEALGTTGYVKESEGKDAFEICWALERSVNACKGGRSFAYICSNGDVYPCSNCASEGLFLGGNVTENTFSHIWENSFKNIRAVTWNDFKGCETCELIRDFAPGKFCKLRCPPLSKILHNDILYCGATEYAKAASKVRFREWMETQG